MFRILKRQTTEANRPQAQFVRGNEYFSKNQDKLKNDMKHSKDENESSDDENVESNNKKGRKNKNSEDESLINLNGNNMIADDDNDEDDAYNNLRKLKGQRYWAEENPTIKCHNCKQIGHL